MKRKFRVYHSQVVYYESVEVEADSEDEAETIVETMVSNNEVGISDTEFNDVQTEDLGEME